MPLGSKPSNYRWRWDRVNSPWKQSGTERGKSYSDGIFYPGAIEVARSALASRKFFDAKVPDGKRATRMLSFVCDFYGHPIFK